MLRSTMAGLFTRNGIVGSPAAFDAASERRGWPIDRAAVPGAATLPGLSRVRLLSSAAVLNNPSMARAAEVWPSALIGAGIVTASGHASPAVRRFTAWGLRCDAEGRLDWPGIQAASARQMVVTGEAFVHIRYGGPGGMRLQLVPSDLVDPGLHRELGNGAFIHAGVEFGPDGSRVAYHVHSRRPDGYANVGTPARIPAADMLHMFRPLAPGQVRGIPWAAPVLLTLSELDGLLDALLVGARVSAMHAGFLLDQNGTGSGVPYDGVQIGSVLETGLEPGTLKVLPAGWDIKFSTPAAAGQAVELAKLNLRSVAMGLGLPDHILSGDLSNANYSSLRAALVEWRGRIEQIQYQVIIPQMVRPVWESWLNFSLLTGELDDEVTSDAPAEFYPPAQPWVDPLKDAEAEAALIAAGLKSRRQAVAAQGYDVETLDAEIAADRAREAALGLDFRPAGPAKPGEPA